MSPSSRTKLPAASPLKYIVAPARYAPLPLASASACTGAVLSTVTATAGESVVLPALSVARATTVYGPSAGCELQVRE